MPQNAQYLRPGAVILVAGEAMRVLQVETMRQGATALWVRLRLRNLRTGEPAEPWLGAATTDLEPAPLERKPDCKTCVCGPKGCIFADPQARQYEVTKEALGAHCPFLESAMAEPVTLLFYEGRPVAVELPPKVRRVIAHTEPPGRAGLYPTGRKLAALHGSRFPVVVPAQCAAGDTVEIDTRTGEVTGPCG